MVLVRKLDDSLSCLSNVCTHRANIIVHNPSEQKNLRCLYHGRKFNLDGEFKSMPDFEEAKNFFHTALKINDRYIDSYNNLGACLLELEKLDEAKKIFDSAYDLDKKNVSTLINLANVLSLQDNIVGAVNHYNEALRLEPNNQEIISNLAICYCRDSKEKEAKIFYDLSLIHI